MIKNENVIQAFGADHLVKLTGLSKHQLQYWDKTDFFHPRYAFENRRSPYSRVYSFRDVVGLRTISKLRKDHGVSLQHLRLVAEELGHLNEDLWSQTTLYVLNKEVYFDEPKTGKTRGIVSGQYTAIPLARVAKEVSSEIAKLGKRTKGQIGDVERHRHVARNSWVLAGTRIPTKTIKRFFDAGYSKAQIMKEYPVLTRKDIDAALNHEQKPAKSA